MPWNIKQGAAGCKGYAVVKEGTNELVGCHDSETKAKAQLRALYANVGKTKMGNGFPIVFLKLKKEFSEEVKTNYVK
jgi:hypothetical protein